MAISNKKIHITLENDKKTPMAITYLQICSLNTCFTVAGFATSDPRLNNLNSTNIYQLERSKKICH